VLNVLYVVMTTYIIMVECSKKEGGFCSVENRNSPLKKVYRAVPNDFYDLLLDLVKDRTRISVHIRLALSEFKKVHKQQELKQFHLPSKKRTFYITQEQYQFINVLSKTSDFSKTDITQNAIYYYLKRRGYNV
jgi:hypothetical protein